MKLIDFLLTFAFFLIVSQVYGQSEAERLHGIAYCYQNGLNGYNQDMTKAYEYYKMAAEKGYEPSFNPLGTLLEFGQGTQINLQEAFKWYNKSAEAGNESGQFNLAYCYRDGIGVEKNVDKAIYWFKKCADNGNLRACNLVGRLLESKNEDSADKEAFTFYEKAAISNEKNQIEAIAEGQYWLAMCYVNGIGIDFNENGDNIELARQWLKKSAAHGTDGGKFSQIAKDFIIKPVPPIINFLNLIDTVSNSEFELNVGVKSNNVVKDINVKLNGSWISETRSIRSVKANGYDYNKDFTMSFVEGRNTIIATATNCAGKTEIKRVVTYHKGKLANVNFTAHQTNTNKEIFALTADISSESPITAVVLEINGKASPISIPNVTTRQLKLDERIKLQPGINTYIVSVFNKTGEMKTPPQYIEYIKPDKKIALVIGNSKYRNGLRTLDNPVNDADSIAKKLKSLGFDVTEETNLSRQKQNDVIRRFGDKAKKEKYDIALFFYAGHGVQVSGKNYLIPVDARQIEDSLSESSKEGQIRDESTSVDEVVLKSLKGTQCKVKLMILDACRDNPLINNGEGRSIGNSSEGGLAQMEAGSGILIAFSTAPGKKANDTCEGCSNSPYTSVLLDELNRHYNNLFSFFNAISKKVEIKTRGEQIPWINYSNIEETFFFNKQNAKQ